MTCYNFMGDTPPCMHWHVASFFLKEGERHKLIQKLDKQQKKQQKTNKQTKHKNKQQKKPQKTNNNNTHTSNCKGCIEWGATRYERSSSVFSC